MGCGSCNPDSLNSAKGRYFPWEHFRPAEIAAEPGFHCHITPLHTIAYHTIPYHTIPYHCFHYNTIAYLQPSHISYTLLSAYPLLSKVKMIDIGQKWLIVLGPSKKLRRSNRGRWWRCAELKFTAVLEGVHQGQLGVTAIAHLRHKLLKKRNYGKNLEFFSLPQRKKPLQLVQFWLSNLTKRKIRLCQKLIKDLKLVQRRV